MTVTAVKEPKGNPMAETLELDAETVEQMPSAFAAPAKNKAVAKPQKQQVAPTETVSESTAIFQIIERAARDPNVDLDKMERLMAMRDRELNRVAEQAFNGAMKAAQEEMQPVRADADNPQTKSRYASYAALDRAIRPIYTKHGFSVSFDEADSPKDDHIRCLAYVAHEAGFTRTYRKDMPADGKGAKGGDVMTKTHASGAADSYGMRYLLRKIFNIAVGENDTDGNAPADESCISKEQVKTILDLIEATETPIEKFCEWAKIEAVPDLPARHFDKAISVLGQRKGKSA